MPNIDPARYDLRKGQSPDDAEEERERAVRMSYEDKADELYQRFKEGDEPCDPNEEA